MAKLKRFVLWACVIAASLCIVMVLARKLNPYFRPAYGPNVVAASPNGHCALVQYLFHDKEHGVDPFPTLLLLGEAFYTVLDLKTGKVLRDSSTELPAIHAVSDNVSYMRWTDDTSAEFPEDGGPFHEWSELRDCAEQNRPPAFAGAMCFGDEPSTSACGLLMREVRRLGSTSPHQHER